jgi:hypothetical protein
MMCVYHQKVGVPTVLPTLHSRLPANILGYREVKAFLSGGVGEFLG